jgi:alpha-D-glucose phosphate-specific phosphoglucomutase
MSTSSESAVKFGTDGWRAVIAEEYTFDNLRRVSRALAAYLKAHEADKWDNGVAIGYDTRFLSGEFAREVADTLAACGLKVRLSNRDAPTPAIAWETRSNNRATGIMITASHNPPKWNGFKFFMPNGGPAGKEATGEVEKYLLSGEHPTGEGSVEEFDPRPAFMEQLRQVIDFDLLKKTPGRVISDAVFGTGRGYLDEALRECEWHVIKIRDSLDPMFAGILPDPANPKCHAMTVAHVKAHKAALGLLNDPDADRFGIVDSTGDYLTPNQILPLVYLHLLEHKGQKGPVARTVATTGLLDAIARAHGQEVIETAVGFKWLGAAIEEQGAILGGEESGGLSIQGHLPGKDGILADLLAAEIWAVHQKPLGQLYQEAMEKYGTFYSTRIDLHLDNEAKEALMSKMANDAPSEIAGSKVASVVTLDGVKLNLEDLSWLLMRPSGTEPLVRVYMEANSPERLRELEDAAQALSQS